MDKATMKGESLDWRRGPRPNKVIADEAEEIEEAVDREGMAGRWAETRAGGCLWKNSDLNWDTGEERSRRLRREPGMRKEG